VSSFHTGDLTKSVQLRCRLATIYPAFDGIFPCRLAKMAEFSASYQTWPGMAYALLSQQAKKCIQRSFMNRSLLLGVMCLCSFPAGADAVAAVDASGFIAFNHLDSDNNGYVSRVEARSIVRVERVFDSADMNHDGLLDRREYRSVRPASRESH
jgi:hypothetical protein